MCTIQLNQSNCNCPDRFHQTLDEMRLRHFTTMGNKMDEMRTGGKFTDVSLACGSRVFTAHKAVLCASSPYFKDLLSGEQRNNDCIELESVDPEPMDELLHFMYTGNLTVSADDKERLKNVLFLADFLQMQDVCDYCCSQILQSTSIKAFTEAWDSAYVTNNDEMEREIVKCLGRHFCILCEAMEFLKLSSERVYSILTCSTLSVPTQDTVLRAVLTWLKHQDKECIDTYMLTLLPLVKFRDVSLEYLQGLLEEEPLVCDYPTLEQRITRAVSLRFLKARVHNNDEVFYPLVTMVVQMKDNSLVMFRYDTRKAIWLNPETISIPKLQQYELVPKVVSVNGSKIYIIGGRIGGTSLNSVYIYDTGTKTIRSAPKMFYRRAQHAVCHLNDSVYVAGGINTNGYLNYVERFKPEDDYWKRLAPLSETKIGITLCSLNDRLYCVGGWDGEKTLVTTECYNPVVDQWTILACLPHNRYIVGSAAVDGRLYIVGGREEPSEWVTEDVVLVYDPICDRWFKMDRQAPFSSDEYLMAAWKKCIWFCSVTGMQLLSYDVSKNEIIHVEQTSYLQDCRTPIAVIMLDKNS